MPTVAIPHGFRNPREIAMGANTLAMTAYLA